DADSREYAEQLYGMLEEIRGRRRIPIKSGLFATRTQIVQRIAALVRGPRTTRAHLSALAIVAVAAVSAAALSGGGTFADKDNPVEQATASDEPLANDSALALTDSDAADALASSNEKGPDPAATRDQNPASPAADHDATLTFAGTVVDPDGK